MTCSCYVACPCSRRREKIVKVLQSNPFQFALCFIILLDAIIVIAQILIDINSIKRDFKLSTILFRFSLGLSYD